MDRYAETVAGWTRGPGHVVCHVRVEDLPDGPVLGLLPDPPRASGYHAGVDWDSAPFEHMTEAQLALAAGVSRSSVFSAARVRGRKTKGARR